MGARRIFIDDDDHVSLVAQTPAALGGLMATVTARNGSSSSGTMCVAQSSKDAVKNSPSLTTHVDAPYATHLSQESLITEPTDYLTSMEYPSWGSNSASNQPTKTLRRRHTLPLLSELIGSSTSSQSFTSAFEDFPNFFTSNVAPRQSSENESVLERCFPPVGDKLQPKQGINIGPSPNMIYGGHRRTKSFSSITAEERPKLISTSRQRPITMCEGSSFCIDPPVSKGNKLPFALETGGSITGTPRNPSFSVKMAASGITANDIMDLNKPLPGLPRVPQAVNTVKKRLSRILHLDSHDLDFKEYAGSGRLDLEALKIDKISSVSAKQPSIVGKQIRLWEGLTAVLSRRSESEKTGESSGKSAAISTVNKSTQTSESYNQTNINEVPSWEGSRSYLSYSSEAPDDSGWTMIVRPDLASKSFEDLVLVSRPSTPINKLEGSSPTKNRLVRSPCYADLRLESLAASPITSHQHCAPRRRARTGTLYGTPCALSSGMMDHDSLCSEETDWPGSQYSVDICNDYERGVFVPPSLKREFSFHQNYDDFVDELSGSSISLGDQREPFIPPSLKSDFSSHKKYNDLIGGVPEPSGGNGDREPSSSLSLKSEFSSHQSCNEFVGESSRSSVGTNGGCKPFFPSGLKREFSFHQDYTEFMDESLHRYGRSGFGGRMTREVPVSESVQGIINDRESRIDPSTEKMIEIWGDVKVTPGGTVVC